MLWWVYTNNFCQWNYQCSLSLYQVVGVAQAINKKSGNGGTFTEKDEKVPKLVPSMTSQFRKMLSFRVYRLLNKQLSKLLITKAVWFERVWNVQRGLFPLAKSVLTCGLQSTELPPPAWPLPATPQLLLPATHPSLPQVMCMLGLSREWRYFNFPIYFSSLL